MKKTLIFFFIVLIAPFVMGVQLEMSSSIPQGETAIVKVSGSFIDPIMKENIYFYRGHTQTSFDYDVGRIVDYYYIYFQTQNKPLNNYSINISGVRYYEGTQISDNQLSNIFSIVSEPVDFYVSDGFIITDGNFSISLQNLNSVSLSINIQDSFQDDSIKFYFRGNEIKTGEYFTLSSVENEDIDVSIQNLTETTIGDISFNTANTEYTIPVYIILGSPGTIPVENDSEGDADNETTVENKTESDKGSFWDIFKKENKTEVKNTTTSNNSIIQDGEVIDTTLKTCAQLNGTVCSSSQICKDGKSVYAKDSTCCISSCVEKQTGNTKKIIGWSLIGIVVLLLLWFRIKYNRTRRRKFILPTSSGKKF